MEEGSYSFLPAEVAAKNLSSKDIQQLLMKWGLKDNLKFLRFRFDQEFKQVNLEDFLKDFFNSPSVRSSLVPALSSFSPAVKEVKFELLSTTVISMDFFDPLQKYGITAANGYIKKSMEELVNGVEVGDRLRKALILEDSEEYTTFTEKEREEFIFHLFSRICIGGPVCQYEDYVTEYLNVTKLLYKDLVTVVKDSASEELAIPTLALNIKSIDGVEPFPHKDKIQNFFYLLIDPPTRTATVLYHHWVDFW